MSSDEFYKKKLGSLLNRDKIKLWEAPYTDTTGNAGDVPKETVEKYAKELNIPCDHVTELIENLRIHALQKLSEREKFQNSGMATLKIKAAGNPNKQRALISVEIQLTSPGHKLRTLVASQLEQPSNHLKLICNGHVISDESSLQDQAIKHGSQILALCLAFTESEAQQQDRLSWEVLNTRRAAEMLSDRAEQDQEFEGMDIQIADQTGKPIQLPPGEKKALTLAMTLHEKGRQALKKKVVSLALPLLLEADKEFKQCRASILDTVDNYAVLCLDIVWCYLCLKNVDDLPDAEDRLRVSEMFFHKSYGSDMARLMAVKGSSGEELALMVRLHLLQGIVAFHQQRTQEAARLLSQVESELRRLQVDEDKLTAVMSMGFSEGESRLGLRACAGDVQNAVTHIMRRREEKKETAKKVREEKRMKKLAKHLGKTANGESVNVKNYEMLVGMGYPKGAAAEALRQGNNDVSLALEVLQNHPEFLDLPDPEPSKPVPITDDMVAQVMAMGFDLEMSRRALVKHKGDIGQAIGELVDSGGSIPPPEESPGTSSGSSASTPSSSSDVPQKTEEELAAEKAAISDLVSDLPENEEDYLDITLDEEREFLKQYQALVSSLQA